MFWKPRPSKKLLYNPIFLDPPINKYFMSANKILENAMEFDRKGEKEICKSMLEVLKKHIDNYDKQIENTEFQKDRPNTTSTLKDFYNTKSNEPNKHVLDIILEVLKEKGYYEEDLNIEIIEPVNFNNVVRRKQGFELKLKAFKK